MITNLKQFKESRLVPRNLDGRAEKLRQHNLQLLQNKTIEGSLQIGDGFYFEPNEVKTRIINGDVIITENIPKWLINVIINGNFSCPFKDLISLENSPEIVNGNFNCSYNKLTSLEGMSKYIRNDFYCKFNKTKQFTLKDIPKYTTIKGKIYL